MQLNDDEQAMLAGAHGCATQMAIQHQIKVGDFFGAAEIKHALEDLIWTALPETHHWTTNLVVEFETPDRATGVCDVTCDGITPEGQLLLIAATYWDTFERRAGAWRIARRKVDLFYFKPVVQLDIDATPNVEA